MTMPGARFLITTKISDTDLSKYIHLPVGQTIKSVKLLPLDLDSCEKLIQQKSGV